MSDTISKGQQTSDSPEFTQHAGFLLAQLGRAVNRQYRTALSPIGLKPRATAALLRLRGRGSAQVPRRRHSLAHRCASRGGGSGRSGVRGGRLIEPASTSQLDLFLRVLNAKGVGKSTWCQLRAIAPQQTRAANQLPH